MIQLPDAIGGQQITVRDQARDDPAVAHVVNDVVQLRMQHRFTAAEGDHGGAEIFQLIDAPQHLFGRYGLGEIIELVAISASQIAAPDRNQMREQRMVGRHEGFEYLPQSMSIALDRFKFAADCR